MTLDNLVKPLLFSKKKRLNLTSAEGFELIIKFAITKQIDITVLTHVYAIP